MSLIVDRCEVFVGEGKTSNSPVLDSVRIACYNRQIRSVGGEKFYASMNHLLFVFPMLCL